ncbi:MAG TPA: hypothetical protein VGI81_27465 [Tepidisphaeraceae bacterium]|jgi:hypothetical protein
MDPDPAEREPLADELPLSLTAIDRDPIDAAGLAAARRRGAAFARGAIIDRPVDQVIGPLQRRGGRWRPTSCPRSIMEATLDQARAAKDQALKVFSRLADVVGVGITRLGDGFAVKVNLRGPPPADVPLAQSIAGVPVKVDIVGTIRTG